MSGYGRDAAGGDGFERSRELFESLVSMLGDPAAADWTHTDLEDRLAASGRELLRSLTQDHLDLRAEREQARRGVVDADGVARTRVESAHQRTLRTVYGPVQVHRKAYRAPGVDNLYPADAVLNLPAGKHSHGLRRLAATEATRGSFDAAAAAIGRATGTRIGKRQVEDLTRAAAVDVEAFYAAHHPAPAEPEDILVLSVDGKGVVMRPDAVEQVDQVRAELDNYAQFAALVEDYIEINEVLCTARVGPPARRGRRVTPAGGGQRGGSSASRTGPKR